MAPTIEEVLAFLDHTGLSQTREVLLHELHDYGLDASSASLTGVVGEGPPSAGADIDSQTGHQEPVLGPSTGHRHLNRASHLDSVLARQQADRALQQFATQSAPWGDSLNEYESLEDVGYHRTDVQGQQHFLETEIDDADRDPSAPTSSATPQALSNTNGSDFAGDSDSTCGSDISGAVINLMPSNSGHMAAPPASPTEGAPHLGRSALDLEFPTTADTTWDLGPIGIRIADPVSTPTKSCCTTVCDEPKPVLSRVESLSSSFKDFDIDCNDDDLSSRRVSSAQEVVGCNASTSDAAPAEVIDFHPTLPPTIAASLPAAQPAEGTGEPVATAPPVLDLSPPSAASASAPSPSPQPAAASGSDPGVELAPPSPREESSSPGNKDSTPDLTLPIEPRESGVGGFSFPVTTPPAEPQPDHHLFKSWPSVRSSCTSEVIAASDDDHVAADYADDEYLRSVSKPSSRSASQNLGEFPKSGARSQGGEDEQQPGLEGWSFAQPKQIPPPTTHSRKRSPHIDPQLSVSPPSASKCGAAPASTSCISEPSTTTVTSYNTCLPAGLLGVALGSSSSSVPQLSVEAPESPATSASPPATAREELKAAPKPIVTKAGAGTRGEVQMSDLRVQDVDSKAGVGAATSSPAGTSPREQPAAGTEQATDEGAGGAASTQGVTPEEGVTPAETDIDDEGGVTGEGEDDMDSAMEAVAALEWQQLQVHPAESGPGTAPSSPGPEHLSPSYTVNEDGTITFVYDSDYINEKYEVLDLRIFHRRGRTGFEETKDFPIRMHDLIAGRYQVVDFLGSAAFSRAVQALDIKTGMLVCLKIIKNNKDYFDQSLDEIKLLKYVNTQDPEDKWGIVRLYDYFYYKEHLFLVCELLRANLYEFQKYNRESGEAPYFTVAKIQSIAKQVLRSLFFLHQCKLIHSDLKPENILIKSYSRCEVKVIDLGSSCFTSDQLSSYVQSRSYRAPEVILGLPYDHKVDIWSLGCILAELSSGQVLFQNDSLPTLLARLIGILGPIPHWMLRKGRYSGRFFTRSGQLYEKNANTDRFEVLTPKRTSLRHRVPEADEHMLSFIAYLLQVDPHKRPSAQHALQHPWFNVVYNE